MSREPTEMEERCARAYCKAIRVDPEGDWRLHNGVMLEVAVRDPRNWVHYLPRVRAVIRAMREPTNTMLTDCGTVDGWGDDTAWPLNPDDVHKDWWSNMIDSASPPE